MRFTSTSILFLVLLVAAAAPACSCGGDDTAPPAGAGGQGAGGAQAQSVRVEPPDVTLTVELGGTATQAYQAFATIDGQEVEVTGECAWSVAPAFGTMAGPTLTALPRGGETQVVADCSGATGSSALTVDLVGTVIAGMAPANAPDLFDTAAPADDPAREPPIVYPLHGAIAPLNLPPIDVQWLAAGNDLFHVALSAPHLAIDVYTTDISAMLPEADWAPIAATGAGADLTIEVAGLLQADPATKFMGAPVVFRISRDNLDKTAIYWWASSQSSLITQTFGSTSAPTSIIANCTSCHSVSRAGSRIGYSRCVGGSCGVIRVGFMRFDKANNTWVETVNADVDNGVNNIAGSYTTFAPLGNPFPDDTRAVALVTMSGGSLQLYDPDTGALIPSNAPTQSKQGPNGTLRAALMPDWSPDGTQVVFASTPNDGQWIDLSDSDIAVMSYAYDGMVHDFGAPQVIVGDPIDLPSGTYSNFFFPSFSPDGQYIVFNAARAAWRANPAHTPGQRLMLTDTMGSSVVELAGMNGEGDLDITWPHWAPNTQGEYLWVVFASQRDYGHKVTEANSHPSCIANGVLQCKQLWIGAIDRQTLTSGGSVDPSAPPVWLPGQDIAADNISPYWTVPTSEIPR